jgi:hypothetical protein
MSGIRLLLTNCSKWRLSKRWGGVAHTCPRPDALDTSTCYQHLHLDSEVELDMHITIEAGSAFTIFNTAGMHALLTRWTHHDSITVRVRLTHRHAIHIFIF